jgi:TRAP transporter TAXI family solute receptor
MIDRRRFGLAFMATAAVPRSPAQAQVPTLTFLTAGPGSAFLPYGEGIANVVNSSGLLRLDVIQTKGSIENLTLVEADAGRIGTVFIGPAYEAINGIGPFAGKKHSAIRAIAPMYETSFQTAAKAGKNISRAADLAGKRVGVGPAGGPAEIFFKGLAEVMGFTATIVNGSPAELEAAYLSDQIDAFWLGAGVPIPSLSRVAERAESVVFGLADGEIEAMLKRFSYLSAGEVAAGTYRGQEKAIRSVAAWNVIVANAALDEDTAYILTREILGAESTLDGTTLGNAPKNRVVPWHPGAADFLREKGVAI